MPFLLRFLTFVSSGMIDMHFNTFLQGNASLAKFWRYKKELGPAGLSIARIGLTAHADLGRVWQIGKGANEL